MMEMTHNPWLFSSVNPGKYATYKYRKAGLTTLPFYSHTLYYSARAAIMS